jgi:hypothetical protein
MLILLSDWLIRLDQHWLFLILTWIITYQRLYYHHLVVDHFGTWTISLRGYHPSIKSVFRHGYGLLDILIF